MAWAMVHLARATRFLCRRCTGGQATMSLF